MRQYMVLRTWPPSRRLGGAVRELPNRYEGRRAASAQNRRAGHEPARGGRRQGSGHRPDHANIVDPADGGGCRRRNGNSDMIFKGMVFEGPRRTSLQLCCFEKEIVLLGRGISALEDERWPPIPTLFTSTE